MWYDIFRFWLITDVGVMTWAHDMGDIQLYHDALHFSRVYDAVELWDRQEGKRYMLDDFREWKEV